jgi:hypothetical protein
VAVHEVAIIGTSSRLKTFNLHHRMMFVYATPLVNYALIIGCVDSFTDVDAVSALENCDFSHAHYSDYLVVIYFILSHLCLKKYP